VRAALQIPWAVRLAADQVFEIKYGVLRGEVNVLPDSECEACELAKRKELEKREDGL